MRVPVVSKNRKPLMPTTPGRAKALMKSGVAAPRRNKLGVFYIRMLRDVGSETQPMALAVDPGAKYDGIAAASQRNVELKGMVFLPEGVPDKMKTRSQLRRARRFRNCPRRPKRFNNRRRGKRWLAPTQRSKVECRLKVVKELCKTYPIALIITEDVKFNHAESREGRYFSTVEIGKTITYEEYKKLADFKKVKVSDTDDWREQFGLSKYTDEKWKAIPETHANDAVAMLMGITGCKNSDAPFHVWWRLQYARRSLHRQKFQKGGVRPIFGRTTNGGFLRKGDWVEAEKADVATRGWVCGLPTEKTKAVGIAGANRKRISQLSPRKIRLLARNGGFSWKLAT